MAFWDDWFSGIADWVSSNNWNELPTSALFIAITAIFLASISTFATRLILDTDALKESMQKVNDWNQKRKTAMQTADKKLWLSVKRDEERVKKLQSSMMFKRMKPMLFTTIPFLLLFAILRTAFPSGEFGHNYAWLPFNLGGFPWIGNPWLQTSAGWENPAFDGFSKVPFTLWYFMVSFAFGSLLSRIFGATPSGATHTRKKSKKIEPLKQATVSKKEQLALNKSQSKANK
ncbi:MAG: EMC3/TMCO1 family protein [Candidatus Heimdallarchaeaceae archaeon]